MANSIVILAQPTTYSQMLNYLLPTKQAGSTTYVPRITQNVGGTLTDQNSAAGLNDFDHWHNGNHTHIGLDLTYGQLNTATGISATLNRRKIITIVSLQHLHIHAEC